MWTLIEYLCHIIFNSSVYANGHVTNALVTYEYVVQHSVLDCSVVEPEPEPAPETEPDPYEP